MLSAKEQDAVEAVNRKFRDLMNTPEIITEVVNSILEDMVDEITLGIVFEVHRSATLGLLEPEEDLSGEDNSRFCIVESHDLDVFGQPPVVKKFQDCICPNCNRGLAASRFAPHLEKCMGMGRSSSRIASLRIANNSRDTSAMGSEDEDDADWTVGSDRRRKRRDRSNGNSKRLSKNQKTERRNGDSGSGSQSLLADGLVSTSGNNSSVDSTTLDSMRLDDRRVLLSQICGVVSEHTRKLCTRSLRCPQHSDEQRRSLRSAVLVDDSGFQNEIQVNVESIGLESDEVLAGLGGSVGILGGGIGLSSLSRGSWETERSNTSSPADSISVSSSTSSKKRDKSSPGKSGSHKKKSSKHSSSHEL